MRPNTHVCLVYTFCCNSDVFRGGSAVKFYPLPHSHIHMTYAHIYIHTHIPIYIHTYIYTYIHASQKY